MNYLTQIIVDKTIVLRQRLTDSYAWHQVFWQSFPGRHGQERCFLSRVDYRDRYYQALLLSEDEPAALEWGEWATKAITPSFLEHSHYRFALRANPTIKRVVRDEQGERRKNGRREAIYDRDTLREWLDRKGQEGRFEILQLDFDPPVSRPFRRRGVTGKHVSVDYRGVLRVLDRQAFQETFRKGVGPAKAFGFGLLMLQPIH